MRSHDYKTFAKEYSQLGIKDTFYLAYRDIPSLIKKYVQGKHVLDYGCGSGRSTRFLKTLGLTVTGIDTSKEHLLEAKKLDQKGVYTFLKDSTLPYNDDSFDCIFLCLVLMEVSSLEKMKKMFLELHRVLKKNGTILIVTDAENMYKHETASFTYNFPENKKPIKGGMQIKLGFRGTNIVFYDYYWTQKDYKKIFTATDFKTVKVHNPLATGKEPFVWHSEMKHPHFSIYVLKKNK